MLSCLLTACGSGGASGIPVTADTGRVSVPSFYPGNALIPVSGPEAPDGAPLDQSVQAMMKRWNLPGVSVAVAKEGRLIFARGYGYADFEAKHPMQPDSMARVGSVSKLITGLGILRLKDRGLLDLDQTFLSILSEYEVQPGGDSRLRDITLRHLLQHSGGWDKSLGEDATNQPFAVKKALGLSAPPTCRDVIRYVMGQPLQFTPGTKVAYSNVGFCILGQVAAKVSGQTYESYLRDQVLAPADVHAMSIGQPHASERGPFEAKYYTHDGAPLVDSVFPGEGKVSYSYSIDPLTLEGAGGWVGSAVDLTRVMTAVEGSRVANFLSADTRIQMLADPHLPGSDEALNALHWRGLGVAVGPTEETYWHGGIMSGSQAMLMRDSRGYTFCVVTNARVADTKGLAEDLINTVAQWVDAAPVGSAVDLFPQYRSPSLPARNP